MKKILLPLMLFALISSCGSDDSNSESATKNIDYEGIMAKMVEEKKLDEDIFKSIKDAIQIEKENEEDAMLESEPFDSKTALKVNSVKLFQDIQSDRALNMTKYLGKTIIITDVILKNVRTADRGESFVRCASAFPYNPKTNEIAYTYNGDWDESPYFEWNGKQLDVLNDVAAKNENGSIQIEFKNLDEMKKINALDWECAYGNMLEYKVDIICRLTKNSFKYDAGSEIYEDLQAKKISLSIENAEIYKK